MTWDVFVLFFVSTLLISATPGPNMLLAFQYGLNYGIKRTLWTLAGLSVGLFMLLLAALLGLDVISRQFPWLLTVIKVVGALYLAYLGVQSWRHANDNSELMTDADTLADGQARIDETKNTPWRLFRIGVWVSLSNPKAILFFAAFFPKFINFDAPLWPQYVLLTLGFFVSETSWQIVYTVGGKRLAGWLNAGERLAWLNRICGIIFVLIAAALLWEVVAVAI